MSVIKREAVSVVAVHKSNVGTDLLGDHASGVSALLVDDASAFNESGGKLSIGGDTLTYLSWSDVDDDTCSIVLADPTTSSYDDETSVSLLPLTPVMTADVVPAGGGPSLEATIWHSLDGYLREGVRDPDEQEAGTIHYVGDYEKVELVDARGKKPALDPAVLDTGDVVLIDGAPDSFYHSAATGYMTYAEAVTFAGSTFADAVAAIVAEAGHIEVAGNTITATGGSTHRVYPAWRIPTNGKQCRVVMDAPTVGSGTGSQDLTFEINSEQDDTADSGNTVDDFLYSFDFDSAPDGMSARIWYEHVGQFGDVATSLPAGAIGTALTSDFQLAELVSLTPAEAGVDDPAAPFLVVVLEYPVASWGAAGSDPSQSFVINNLRVIRE